MCIDVFDIKLRSIELKYDFATPALSANSDIDRSFSLRNCFIFSPIKMHTPSFLSNYIIKLVSDSTHLHHNYEVRGERFFILFISTRTSTGVKPISLASLISRSHPLS